MRKWTRRDFLKFAATTGAALSLPGGLFDFNFLEAAVDNPLEAYPDRNWESVYRDQYAYDDTFTFVCSPNDTHACRLKAFMKNGVLTRTGPNYDVHRYADLDGNTATRNWGPRTCAKGYTFHRRVYGPYRLTGPVMRRGWKRWADDGYPYLTDALREQYKFDSRGTDEFLRVTWDEAYEYMVGAYVAISEHYSGEEGAERLLEQGYDPAMVEALEGAGTLTNKFRGGMGLLGVIGKYGMYRIANMMGILDTHVRGVSPDEAKGGRRWCNYTWHGDQAPGHPFVHGVQASDVDMNELRSAKLHVQCGKNLVENKMTDSHWFIEVLERGGKVVAITPEYSPPATKADYWIPIRPNTDTALFLGISKILIDRDAIDRPFLKRFSDMPLLIRSDTGRRLRPTDILEDYDWPDISDGKSVQRQHFEEEDRRRIGDFMVWDPDGNRPVPVTHDDVGDVFEEKGVDPALEGRYTVRTVEGEEVEVAPLFELYKDHLADYDLETVEEITHAPAHLVEQLAEDFATIEPACIHVGEGINHWFHATMVNRATYLPVILTGNIGKPGAGSHTWAGNYKAGIFQSDDEGPGWYGWVAEDPFDPELDPEANGCDVRLASKARDEAVAYWNHGDKPLVVDTPRDGRKVFTGETHMPTPTKSIWFTNVNLINNAKWAYEMIANVNPKIDMIVSNDIQLTGSVEYSDIALPANSWAEFQNLEITASCSNPFLQIWDGGLEPLYDSRDDVMILAGFAEKMAEVLDDDRFRDYWRFALEGRPEVYIQRLLDASSTTRGYRLEDIMAGEYGEPGGALVMYRTYPRFPFYEQVEENEPFWTPTGRIQVYNDEPEVLEYGENFIVHREGPEATPYLPNVIVSSNPLIRPDDYGLDPDDMDWDVRHVRNIKMPWNEVKETTNPLWEAGFQFYCLTPKSRHSVHSQWIEVDWHQIWGSNFGDPYRMDKRQAGAGEHQVHLNPQAARDMGIEDGDYVYVDANPADRPYIGWEPDDPFYRVARCMLRVKYNPAYPYHVAMMKHGTWIATERTVEAHENREDGLARSEETGYQATFRYGSQQSITRSWLMPMHQLDSLFHKKKISPKYLWGGETDNHVINTTPKETLVRIVKAEDGGRGGTGVWEHATTGFSPDAESDLMERYMRGDLTDGRGS